LRFFIEFLIKEDAVLDIQEEEEEETGYTIEIDEDDVPF
jgi:hypothetical protein